MPESLTTSLEGWDREHVTCVGARAGRQTSRGAGRRGCSVRTEFQVVSSRVDSAATHQHQRRGDGEERDHVGCLPHGCGRTWDGNQEGQPRYVVERG